MSTIKPYKETKCKLCIEMEEPDLNIKKTVSGYCFAEKPFHYQSIQQEKHKAKQEAKDKVVKPAKSKSPTLPASKKSLPKLLLEAQETFNRFIRLRDQKQDYFICISCNRLKPLSQMNAGHYYSAGNHSYLRFNEMNVHGQCIQCNCHLHGNLIPYRENLIKKIGSDELQKLDTLRSFSHKWDRIQALAIIQLYKGKIKDFARP